VELAAGNGDRIQLFGRGHRYFEFCRSQGASIVPLLKVDDLNQAGAELARSGAELLGGPESDRTWTWLTFLAPDGNIHTVMIPTERRRLTTECGSASSDLVHAPL